MPTLLLGTLLHAGAASGARRCDQDPDTLARQVEADIVADGAPAGLAGFVLTGLGAPSGLGWVHAHLVVPGDAAEHANTDAWLVRTYSYTAGCGLVGREERHDPLLFEGDVYRAWRDQRAGVVRTWTAPVVDPGCTAARAERQAERARDGRSGWVVLPARRGWRVLWVEPRVGVSGADPPASGVASGVVRVDAACRASRLHRRDVRFEAGRVVYAASAVLGQLRPAGTEARPTGPSGA